MIDQIEGVSLGLSYGILALDSNRLLEFRILCPIDDQIPLWILQH